MSQASAIKLRKNPTSRTGTAELQYARQLLGSSLRDNRVVTTYNKKEYNFCFNN